MQSLLDGGRAAVVLAVGLWLGPVTTARGAGLDGTLAQIVPQTAPTHEHLSHDANDMGDQSTSAIADQQNHQMDTGVAPSDREQMIHEHGSSVMPFDLTLTMHHFQILPDGGLETVTANDPTDNMQVWLIQRHLSELAAQFQHGDFSDPATLHGSDMPGLVELSTAGSRLQILYAATSDGGQIRFASQDPQIITALHQWFAAQLADHGADAIDR